jgi:hypothetical protein
MFLKMHFFLHDGQIAGGAEAVSVKPHSSHFQYVCPHSGQISSLNAVSDL